MFTNVRRMLTATLVALVACGGGGDTPTEPTTKPPPVVPPPGVDPIGISIVSLAIPGQQTIHAGSPTQYKVMARYSDGSEKEVTSPDSWKFSDPLGSVSSQGVVIGITLGTDTLDVSATLESKKLTASRTVDVIGTPWSQLPALSDSGKAHFAEMYGSNFMVTRWKDFPITVWVAPAFRAEIQAAFDFWTTATKGVVKFAIANDSTTAQVVTILDPNWLYCASGGPSFIAQGAVTSAIIRIKPNDPKCYAYGPEGADVYFVPLAHELGHVLGLGHTIRGSGDMMSVVTNRNPGMSPLLSEIINWLYSVPPGTKPID